MWWPLPTRRTRAGTFPSVLGSFELGPMFRGRTFCAALKARLSLPMVLFLYSFFPYSLPHPFLFRTLFSSFSPPLLPPQLSDSLAETHAEESFTTHPTGHWTAANMRSYLESFLRRRDLNPLSPASWYSITSETIRSTKVWEEREAGAGVRTRGAITCSFFILIYFFIQKGGRTILEKFKGGYWQMLKGLFPDITFDYRKFDSLPTGCMCPPLFLSLPPFFPFSSPFLSF